MSLCRNLHLDGIAVVAFKFCLLDGIATCEDNAVHQVEVITLDGYYVAYITYHITFATYEELGDFDVLTIGDRRYGCNLATLLGLQYNLTRFTLFCWNQDGNLTVASALKSFDGGDRVYTWKFDRLNLVQISTVEIQGTATKNWAWTE